jgi:prophage DNA circulation protein
LNALLRTPRDLAARLTSLIGGLQSLALAPDRALRTLRGLFDYGGKLLAVASGTPARTRQAVNQAAVVALVQRTALVEAVRASSQVVFSSYDEAVALRDELAEQLDRHLEEADDASYVALTDLKVAMVRDINARGADLARVLTIVLPATLPALVISHRLYGDTASEADIVARNRVRHPGFVPGGRPIEVLTRA